MSFIQKNFKSYFFLTNKYIIGGNDMISNYEYQFMNAAIDIYQHGYEEKNERTGISTRRKSHVSFSVDLQKEFPILTSKHCMWKSAIDEILWIFQKQSNNIHDLNSHIWDKWADEEGSIGTAYGYQVKKYSQVQRLLELLSNDHSSRRAVMDLWNFGDIDEMHLTPCVYTSVWDAVDGKLNVLVTSRSCDLLLGGVFNMIQYAALCHMFARHLKLEPGQMTFIAADCHIYMNQEEGFGNWVKQYKQELAYGRYNSIKTGEEQDMFRQQLIDDYNNSIIETTNAVLKYRDEHVEELSKEEYDEAENVIEHNTELIKTKLKEMLEALSSEEYERAYNAKPFLWLNPEVTDFFDFTMDDIKIQGYDHLGKISMPVAQ